MTSSSNGLEINNDKKKFKEGAESKTSNGYHPPLVPEILKNVDAMQCLLIKEIFLDDLIT